MKLPKKIKRIMRHRRIRATIKGTRKQPRLSVYRSNKHTFVQLIDDDEKRTIIGISDTDIGAAKKMTKSTRAFSLGELLAEKAIAQKLKKIVFDRGGYKYQGRVQKIAEGARKGGLEF